MKTLIKRIKRRIFEIIEVDDINDQASRIFDIFIITLICLNIIILIVETLNIPDETRITFHMIELLSVFVFTTEYALRMWTSDMLFPKLIKPRALIRYIVSPMAIIDLLAILPFYLPFIVQIDLRMLWLLRIFRLSRMFKLNRYTNAFKTIMDVLRSRAPQLLSSVFVVVLLMIITSLLMYNAEHKAQPEVFQNAFSGLWWSVATFTTVGYGDIYPITLFGKVLGGIIALLGIGLLAVPTGIISAGFIENINRGQDKEIKSCPYCGRKI